MANILNHNKNYFFKSPIYIKEWPDLLGEINSLCDEYIKKEKIKDKEKIDERNNILGISDDRGWAYHSEPLYKDDNFKTFHTIINESYDVIQNPNERLEAIMQLVLDLNKKSQRELNDMVYAVKDILIHNRSLLLKKIIKFTNIKK